MYSAAKSLDPTVWPVAILSFSCNVLTERGNENALSLFRESARAPFHHHITLEWRGDEINIVRDDINENLFLKSEALYVSGACKPGASAFERIKAGQLSIHFYLLVNYSFHE